MKNNCYLILEDGSVYTGKGFGKQAKTIEELVNDKTSNPSAGEVVFNTGMAGYHEILTDPSYKGQIIVMTYPHIGNYGTDEEWNESGNEKPDSGRRIKASGLAVRSLYEGPRPFNRKSLDEFLSDHGLSGITDIDTRRLTLRIRNEGSPTGLLVSPEKETLSKSELSQCMSYLKSFPCMEGRDLVTDLGTREPIVFNEKGAPHICLIDSGVKANIIRDLVKCGCKVTSVPNSVDLAFVQGLKTDGVLFANGPGDPAVLAHLIGLAGDLIGKKPVFGICLGHQLISIALGAKSYKMKFGHHGVNNPVRDESTKVVLITSQNHGFAIDEKSLSPDIEVRFRNVNDQTIEGIYHKKLPVYSVQFHPEAAPGPRDSFFIFKGFLELIGK
ncbi:MAG: glutamine-hydrolyzing carbamoyl-phosphate synthase small subunit [Spirochaetales bacterium]|nr:glutamine-hydrolyzing carbamoyl-phosphate synthase small subunit [Spirochaetales bacterium]